MTGADETKGGQEPRWPIYLAAAAAIISSGAAVISSMSVLNATRLAAQERVFERKLEACGEISRLATRISSSPQGYVLDGQPRSQAVEEINGLLLVFPNEVTEAGLVLINRLDIVYAKQSDGRPIEGQDWGSLMQAAVELDSACRADVRAAANVGN